LSIALSVQAARRGYRVAFATAHEWVGRLGAAKRAGRLDEELERLRRIPLVVVDEVGYIPFDPEAAALFFALVSSRYERASLIVSSNKTFSAWAEIFGDPVAVAAMVDRLVHHAEVIVLKGESYRLRGRGKEVIAGQEASGVERIRPALTVKDSTGVDTQETLCVTSLTCRIAYGRCGNHSLCIAFLRFGPAITGWGDFLQGGSQRTTSP